MQEGRSTLLEASRDDIDFAEVRGQESAKRALTIAATVGHNLLTLGLLTIE